MLFLSRCYPGHVHDFTIFKEIFAGFDFSSLQVFVDLGFLGIQNIVVGNAIHVPHKRAKKRPLTGQQWEENRAMTRVRVVVENAIAKIKSFFVLRIENRMKIKAKLDAAFEICTLLANFKNTTTCKS